MRRWILHSAALVSFLLLIAAITFSVRSRLQIGDVVRVETSGGRAFHLFASLGRIEIGTGRVTRGNPTPKVSWTPYSTSRSWRVSRPNDPLLRRLGFQILRYSHVSEKAADGATFDSLFARLFGTREKRIPVTAVVVPIWFLILVFSLVPLLQMPAVVRYWRSRHRRTRGLCPFGGYDLRATPERCPECGYEPPADAAEAQARDAVAGFRGGGG